MTANATALRGEWIRKLLALSTSPNQHEAAAARAKARELMKAAGADYGRRSSCTAEGVVGSRYKVREVESSEEESFTLVEPEKIAPRQGRISVRSPVGRALVGSRPGDIVTADTPNGPLSFRVLAVGFGRESS